MKGVTSYNHSIPSTNTLCSQLSVLRNTKVAGTGACLQSLLSRFSAIRRKPEAHKASESAAFKHVYICNRLS